MSLRSIALVVGFGLFALAGSVPAASNAEVFSAAINSARYLKVSRADFLYDGGSYEPVLTDGKQTTLALLALNKRRSEVMDGIWFIPFDLEKKRVITPFTKADESKLKGVLIKALERSRMDLEPFKTPNSSENTDKLLKLLAADKIEKVEPSYWTK